MRITSPTATGLSSAPATSTRGRQARDDRCHASTSPGGCRVSSSTPPSTRAVGRPLRGAPCASLHRRRPGWAQLGRRRFADGGHGTTDATPPSRRAAAEFPLHAALHPSSAAGQSAPPWRLALDICSTTGPGPPPVSGSFGALIEAAPDSVLIRCCSAAAGRWFVRTARSHKLKTYLCV